MKIEVKLVKSRKETTKGFPVVLEISHQNKRKSKHICFCKDKHFIQDGKNISEKHPDYDILIPVLMDLKLRARKLVLKGCIDVEEAYFELFKPVVTEILFLNYGDELIAEMKKTADILGKNDLKAKNKMLGNIKCYVAAVASFREFGGNVNFKNLNYDVLMRFRNYHLAQGNGRSTVHFYLRTLRAIYNQGIWKHKLVDQKPFVKVFDGLKIRSYDSRKKSISKESIIKLEYSEGNGAKQKYLDLYLLEFYFGGCDLMDLYYLENSKIYWQHAYDVPGKNIDELIKYFEKEVMINFKQDNFQNIDNTISFTINDDRINFKKYGGTTMGSILFIQDYYKYLVVIDFKEEKYRVTIKEIFIDNKIYGVEQSSGYLEEYITKKKQTLFTTNGLATTGIIYNHKHFLEKFERNMNESIKKDW